MMHRGLAVRADDLGNFKTLVLAIPERPLCFVRGRIPEVDRT
jgi:hypothetical protein